VLAQADTLLETGEFAAFWAFVEPHRELVAAIPGFFDAISAFILGVLEITYRRVPRSVLLAALHITDSELETLLAAKKWTADGNDVVLPEPTLPAPKHTPVATAPGVSDAAAQLSRVLSALQQ